MDDNSPRKTDEKDTKTIAKLVTEGRYSFPYLPEGIYAELREAVSVRDQIVKAMNAAANRIQRWLTIYFLEYLKGYKVFDSVCLLQSAWSVDDETLRGQNKPGGEQNHRPACSFGTI